MRDINYVAIFDGIFIVFKLQMVAKPFELK